MSGYKSSKAPWLDRIPFAWDEAPLFTYFRESKVKNTGLAEGNVLSLSYGSIKRRNVDSGMGLLPASFETYQIVEPGDVVMRLTDLQNDQRSLRTGLVHERGIVTSAYLALKPSARVDYRFGHYLLHALDTMKVYYGLGAGVRQTMKYGDLSGIFLAMPARAQQVQIADYLDSETARIDALIDRKQRFIDLLLEKRTALITHAVTKGLDPNAEMKDSGGRMGLIPAAWAILPLKFVAAVQPSNVDKLTIDGETPVELCNYTDVYKNERIQSGMHLMRATATEAEIARFTLQAGDVLITKDSETADDIAVPAVVMEDLPNVLCGYHLAMIRPGGRLVGSYLSYVLMARSVATQLHNEAQGVTRVALGQAKLASVSIPLPSVAEQLKIAEHLDRLTQKIDALVNRTRSSIDLLREYRTALISAAVTGQIEVPDVETSEEVA